MASSSLKKAVDHWTVQALAAAGHLVRLYRALGDTRQAYLALNARGPCDERAQRRGLLARVPGFRLNLPGNGNEDPAAEAKAWQLLVEALAGLAAFHSLVEQGNGKGKALRGSQTATDRALRQAMRGFRAAFPEEVASSGIHFAMGAAAAGCTEAFSLDVEGSTEAERENLKRDLHRIISEALAREADTSQGVQPK